MKKIYYFLDLTQKAPLRLSSGEGEETDSDLRLDSRGLPYIPGTSLTGVLRSRMHEKDANLIFGYIDIGESSRTGTNVSAASRLIVSDAVLAPDTDPNTVMILSRDGVGIDDWGQAVKHAKYDFQAVETDGKYHAVLEWSGDDNSEKEEITLLIEPLLSSLVSEGISFGARTTRGYGEMDIEIRKKVFIFPEQTEEWLSYYPLSKRFGETDRGTPLEGKESARTQTDIEVSICMKDSFNIRVNTSRAECLEDGTVPDSVPLMNSGGQPVIPGTAWAGVFRHHMHRLLREAGMTGKDYEEEIQRIDYDCFGMSRDKKKPVHKKSQIIFSETKILGGRANTITRNAVDRFTAAPKNTGLFTNQVWTGGRGILHIRLTDRISVKDTLLLFAAIYDMGKGLMTIGGEAGIGRGVIEINNLKIDGVNKNEFLDTGCLKLSEERDII